MSRTMQRGMRYSKVVRTMREATGARGYVEYLECGHQNYVPPICWIRAKKRRCFTCEAEDRRKA